MAIDAVCIQAVVAELRPQLIGARIDKIQQPAKDQVVLLFRGRRLLLDAGAGAPRIHLTAAVRDNPAQPPMFCMLLRKHLGGGRLAAIDQPGSNWTPPTSWGGRAGGPWSWRPWAAAPTSSCWTGRAG